MKQKVLLEQADLQTLLRGEELLIALGDMMVPISLDPSAMNGHRNGTGHPTPARPGHHRQFTPEQKAAAVARVKRGERAADVARALLIHRSVLDAWRKKGREGKLRRVTATAPDGSRHTVDERVAAHWRKQRAKAAANGNDQMPRFRQGKRRIFTPAQKAAAVARVKTEGFTAVTKDLQLADSVLSGWLKKAGKKVRA